MDLVLFGIQGSGKGTQAKRFAAEHGYRIFEAGGELRAMAATGTLLGETVKSYIDEGKLVPFAIIMDVVGAAIKACPFDQPLLFDGIPRDRAQMESFDRIMEEASRGFFCIELLVDEEAAIQRILKRAEAEGRKDDADEAIIRRRMATFHEKTSPVIETYRKAGKVVKVEGEGTVEEVFERFVRAVNQWKKKLS